MCQWDNHHIECPHNAYGPCGICTRAHIAKLQAFKDYVHKRLDDAGITAYPNGEHSNAGCRIGDRLDIVFAQLEHFKAQLKEATHRPHPQGRHGPSCARARDERHDPVPIPSSGQGCRPGRRQIPRFASYLCLPAYPGGRASERRARASRALYYCNHQGFIRSP